MADLYATDPAKFKFTGESETVFVGLRTTDGSTVTAQPGEEFEVSEAIHPGAVLHPELEPLNPAAEKLVEVEATKARIDAARVFGEPAKVEVTEGASVTEVAPAEAKAEAPVDPTETAPAAS